MHLISSVFASALALCGVATGASLQQVTNFGANTSGTKILSYSGTCWDVSSKEALTHNGDADSNSIVNMVSYTLGKYNGDKSRVFATGTSSGAMMTNVLAAAYPDVFAAGIAYAGVPATCFYTGTINGWNSTCSQGQLNLSQEYWANAALNAYPGYTGPRPRMRIHHGTADTTLYAQNYYETIKQWTGVFGYSTTPSTTYPNTPRSPYTRYVFGPNVEGILGQGVSHNIDIFGDADMEWFGFTISLTDVLLLWLGYYDYNGWSDIYPDNHYQRNGHSDRWSRGAHYAQCGGIGWTGVVTCVSPYTCRKLNDYRGFTLRLRLRLHLHHNLRSQRVALFSRPPISDDRPSPTPGFRWCGNSTILLVGAIARPRHSHSHSHSHSYSRPPTMGAFSFLRNVYNLDTLDTRFTVSSTTPYKAAVEARDAAAAAGKERAARWNTPLSSSRPMWNTPEFYLYYAALVVTIPAMLWVAYNASKTTHPNYRNYERYLSPGWIPGRKIDATDSQYHTLRSNIPYLTALLVLHPILRRLYNLAMCGAKSGGPASRPTLEEADRRLNQRASFDFGFAIIYLVALHGVSVFKILGILYLNYQVATALPRKTVPVATWVFNVGILFANDLGKGYKFKNIASFLWMFLSGELIDESNSRLVHWGAWLDSYGGLMGRWEILFNITVLRLISFNLDYYWSLERRSYSPIEKQLDPSSLSERDRVSIPAQAKDYSFRNYVAYAIYAPLYLTGPIITFNDYISQLRYKSASLESARIVRYAFRFAVTLLVMEVTLHFDYVQAIAKFSPRWGDYTAAQLFVFSYFNLHMIWLKLLLPWRFFRLWSLVDGIDPPREHASTAGLSATSTCHSGLELRQRPRRARSVLTYVLVFTFVALWHDIQLRLLIWGWLIVFFMLPEMAAGSLFPKRRWETRPTAYRMMCCAGAVVNVFMMMTANLVGFAFGVDGLRGILASIFKHFSGYVFLGLACTALFISVQIMFEVRESEMRHGINLRC
ncbi:hypothetical protein NUW58_g5827 [Xylaria curta]|uniref:Uncharacterized protein n=1 Tax=Xylaria curta TaxID=42375 RepID=A0ACC1P1Y1_9PEZI|nr:hypothetical protein NUW58_g5827 [Xylaria curta]